MFDDFKLDFIDTSAGRLRVRYGGIGTPVLLLHGHPRTHMTWSKVADILAPRFAVVCPDLPGFGHSYIPVDSPDSRHSSKRSKARVLVEMMRLLGHEAFYVVGHDRGSLTAFRMAMDYPDVVRKLVTIDGLPVLEHLERADWKFATEWYHWFFFAQPEKPENAIMADPAGWYRLPSPAVMGVETYDDLFHALRDRDVVHGMIEDYRAGIRIDHLHDRQDRENNRRLHCPMLCLWSRLDDLEQIYGDPVAIWRSWADDVRGFGIDSNHHVAEENPSDLAKAIDNFLLE